MAAALFLVASWLVGAGVHEVQAAAVREHAGDPVAALIEYVETPTHSLRDRNRAVWALGQLGDPRALPVLERHCTGKPCDHEHALCQHELRKAIRLCRGGANVTAPVWRHGGCGRKHCGH